MVPKISPATVGVVSVEGAPAAAEGRELTVAVGGAVVTISGSEITAGVLAFLALGFLKIQNTKQYINTGSKHKNYQYNIFIMKDK